MSITASQIVSFGTVIPEALEQLQNCLSVVEPEARGVLCADHHKGYDMPVGGVMASSQFVLPAGVGYDIGCGNMAMELDVLARDINMTRVMDEVSRVISFGVGRTNGEPVDDAVIDTIASSETLPFQRSLLALARTQLGTVGSGNHYVDLFEDRASGRVWIGVHFGSRGFGHKTATHFLERAAAEFPGPITAIPLSSSLAEDYLNAMALAGTYASAGRSWVVNRVRTILDSPPVLQVVHNHHNYAWWEQHEGIRMLVVRKGATPAFPGQRGFVGGSMGDDAVIIEGIDSSDSVRGLYSAMHGAGRVMGRREAAGVIKRGQVIRAGKVDWSSAQTRVRNQGVELRGAGADEAPECYKRLHDVVAAHGSTIRVCHTLRPIGVAMAGANEFDPYKD